MTVWLPKLVSMLMRIRSLLWLIGYSIVNRRSHAKFELSLMGPSQRGGLQFEFKPVILQESDLLELGCSAALHTPIAVLHLYVALYSKS